MNEGNMKTDRRDALAQYAHPQPNQLFPDVLDDFREVVMRAPEDAIAQGIAATLRSEGTASFAQMVAGLFLHSDGEQRAELLNILVTCIGEDTKHALRNAGLFGLDPDSGQVTAEITMQLSPEAIGGIAVEAKRRDSVVIDRISTFYAQYSAIVSKLDAHAVLRILTHIADRASRDVELWLTVQRDGGKEV